VEIQQDPLEYSCIVGSSANAAESLGDLCNSSGLARRTARCFLITPANVVSLRREQGSLGQIPNPNKSPSQLSGLDRPLIPDHTEAEVIRRVQILDETNFFPDMQPAQADPKIGQTKVAAQSRVARLVFQSAEAPSKK
jgi:hypothetical protein